MDRILRVLTAGLQTAFALMLAGGLAGKMTADDAVSRPRPEQTAPAQGIDPQDASTTVSLVEPPLMESPWPRGKTEAAAVESSPLATVQRDQNQKRSVQLEQVAQQADRRTRHGYELAARGAYFAARSEFIGALRLVAEGLDTEWKNNVHSRALAAALGAMKEAEDFLPRGSRLEADLDLPGLIAIHDAPVLKDRAEGVTSLVALRCYLTFAQEQFAVAVDREVAGSMALHALGKLHSVMSQKKVAMIVAPESKAMVFYQAALLAFPEHSMAANDLGVLLAQCGRCADARAVLERSVTLYPQSTGWRNLSVVYGQLGQTALAERAARQVDLLRQKELAQRGTTPLAANGAVQWVDPQTFTQNSKNTLNTPVPAPISRAAKPTAAVPPINERSMDPRAVRAPSAAERMSWGSRGVNDQFR